MRFKNPANGYVEERGLYSLWTLLFGPLYFLVAGLWRPLGLWVMLGVVLYSSFGPPATLFMIMTNIVQAVMAESMVRAAYLRRGWADVTNGEPAPKESEPAASSAAKPAGVSGASETRLCPMCAEEIKAAAIKCKHCGSDVPALPAPTRDYRFDHPV